jgi:hypothetical protein
MFAYLNGHHYEVILGDDVRGHCNLPGTCPSLTVIPSLKTKPGLEVLLHEALHAELPKQSEQWIKRVGIELSNLLWKHGYRQRRRKKKR